MKKMTVSVFIFMVVFVLSDSALADKILVIRKNINHNKIKNTIQHLEKLESDGVIDAVDVTAYYFKDYARYKQYDQIWDLNYEVSLSSETMDFYKNFLKDGGNLYISGEYASTYDARISRNSSISSFLKGIDAVDGSFFIKDNFPRSSGQIITEKGENVFPELSEIKPGSAAISPGFSLKNGFLVSEYVSEPDCGFGSFMAWDQNDLTFYPDARLFVGLDVDFLGDNDKGVTEDLINFLSGNTAPVPVPAAVWFFVTGLAGLGIIRKKKDKKLAP